MFGAITPHCPGFSVVYRTWGKIEAEVIKGRLESAGIPVLLDYESAGPAIGIVINGLGEVRVLVPDEHAPDAQLLLSEPSGQDADEAPEALRDQSQDGV